MKIVFLNVWGSEMRSELIPYIKTQARDTDIFCFQEATENMKRSCMDVLADYHEVSDYKYISENDNFSQSIFIKNSIKTVSSGALLADDMDVGLAIYVELQIRNTTVFICNVHGRARPREKMDTPDRLRLSESLINFFSGKDAPVVIGGDFNLEHTTESVAIFQAHKYRNLIKDFSIRTTRNHFAWDRYPGNEMYYSDYIFLNNKVHLKKFVVDDDEISDHLPMILEIDT